MFDDKLWASIEFYENDKLSHRFVLQMYDYYKKEMYIETYLSYLENKLRIQYKLNHLKCKKTWTLQKRTEPIYLS